MCVCMRVWVWFTYVSVEWSWGPLRWHGGDEVVGEDYHGTAHQPVVWWG